MSVIVAIKHEGKVYIGADSQCTKGGTRRTLSNPNNYKIWQVQGAANCIMGHVGVVRDANIIRVAEDLIPEIYQLKDQVDFKLMVRRVVPFIQQELEEYKAIDKSSRLHMDSSFILAYKDKLFTISSNGTVIEVDDYCAIGSGESEALGSLLSTESLNPMDRIKTAIKASAANDIYVDYPIVIGDTSTDTFKVFYEKDL